MKVIIPGREQKGWAREYTCTGEGNEGGGCGAVLLVEENDLFTTTSSCMGEIDYYVTFKCEACGILTDIKERPAHTKKLPTEKEWLQWQENKKLAFLVIHSRSQKQTQYKCAACNGTGKLIRLGTSGYENTYPCDYYEPK